MKWTAVLMSLFLCACVSRAPLPPTTQPVPNLPSTPPLITPNGSPDTDEEPTTPKHIPAIGVMPTEPAKQRPLKKSPIVTRLLSQSNGFIRAKKFSQATATLERALRIEPKSAQVWQQLALVKLAEGNYSQAINMALKSNSLAGQDKVLRHKNAKIISQAKAQSESDY